MTEHVRVKDKATGHEYTVRAEHFNPEAHQRIDKDPYGPDGLPAAPKFRVSLAKPPAPSARPRRRTTRRPAAARVPVATDPAADPEPETDDGQSTAESEQENH